MTVRAGEEPGERLSRFLARASTVSRREADRLVEAGHVTVNGTVVREPGMRVDPDRDSVKVDGKRVRAKSPSVFLLLYKPRGVVCTMEDPEGRPCVGDLLRKVKGRPVPAGRLDFDAEGLLLCTDDGDLVHRLIHPRFKVQKVYLVKVSGIPEQRTMHRLESGVVLDGRKTMPAKVSLVRRSDRNAWLRMTIREGRNRQVKRMLEAVGHRVMRLRRVALGPLKLSGLKPGEMRRLRDEELKKLRESVNRLDKPSGRLYDSGLKERKRSSKKSRRGVEQSGSSSGS